VEVSTNVCGSVDEVWRDLKSKLRRVALAAAHQGLLLAWGGTHPLSHWKDQPVASEPRYRALADSYQETLLRQLTFGLHVHVGVPSGDEAISVCDRIRDYLPVLLAISANSPYWCGHATGLQSHRVDVMGSIPSAGIPPGLGNWQSYVDFLEHLMACGFIETAKDLWWDVRPSPVHGTVEVRVCDMPLGLEMVLGLTSLIQCLVYALSRGDDLPGSKILASQDDRDCDRSAHQLILERNRWPASRHGLDAPLVDPFTRDKSLARVLARRLIDHLIDVAQELDCAHSLRSLRAKTWGPTGALSQLSTHTRTGNLKEVVRLMTRADSSGLRHLSLVPTLDHEPLIGRFEASL
jgi:carboxylate-amine ligase